MSLLAIDPGGNTGLALFDATGNLISMRAIKGHDKALDWIEEQEGIAVYVIEQYRNRPNAKANLWSVNNTSQLIGAISRVARKRKIKVVMQEPSPALSIGLKFLGMHNTYKGQHVPDEVSALAHGEYYIRKNGLRTK
jgi:hypothetical protein